MRDSTFGSTATERLARPIRVGAAVDDGRNPAGGAQPARFVLAARVARHGFECRVHVVSPHRSR